MTREETKKILMVLDATYPSFKVENLTETINAWHFFLQDSDYGAINVALRLYVSTSGNPFAPSVSELLSYTQKQEQMTANEAWLLVAKASANANYNAKEEFEALPEIVQKAVGSPQALEEFARQEEDIFSTVSKSHFLKAFNIVAQRERELLALPLEAREKIKQIGAVL